MLLKKQQKDNKTKVIYKSSTICASVLDETTKDLTVIFNNGGQYKYTAVSGTDYARFEAGDSQGSILNSHIKKYPFVKLDNIDVSAILKEVSELADADDNLSLDEKTKNMFQSMLTCIGFYMEKGAVRTAALSKLEADIAEYKKASATATAPVTAPGVIS